jgi:hypothetical protein
MPIWIRPRAGWAVEAVLLIELGHQHGAPDDAGLPEDVLERLNDRLRSCGVILGFSEMDSLPFIGSEAVWKRGGWG